MWLNITAWLRTPIEIMNRNWSISTSIVIFQIWVTLLKKYIVISVYKNYQNLQRLSCIENAVVSVSLTKINRIPMFCWARQFSLRINQGFKNCHPRLHLMTLKKKAVSISKSRFLSVVRIFCRQVELIEDRKINLSLK